MAHRLVSDLLQTPPTHSMARTSFALALLTVAFLTPAASAQPPVWIQPVATSDLDNISGIEVVAGAWEFSQNIQDIPSSSGAEFQIDGFPTGSLTLQLDLRVDNTAANRGQWVSVLHKGASDSQRTPSLWLSPTDNLLYFSVNTSQSAYVSGSSAEQLPLGEWITVTLVLDAETRRAHLYIDGRLQPTFEFGGTLTGNGGPLHLGSDGTFSSFDGALKNVRIYDRMLEPTLPARFTFEQNLHSEAGLNGLRFEGRSYDTQTAVEDLRNQNVLDLDNRNQGLRVEGLPSSSGLILSFRLFLERDPTTEWRSILHKGAEDLQRAPALLLDPNRILYVATSTSASTNEFVASQQAISPETWTNITLVLDPMAGDFGEMRLYINGALDSTLALGGTIQGNGETLYVGRSPWHGGFAGQVDDLVIQPLLNTTRRETLSDATNHAFFYGDPNAAALNQLATYDLVFIEAAYYTAEEIRTLQNNDTLVIAYASFGEQTKDRRTTAKAAVGDRYDWDIPLGQILAMNANWCSFYVKPTVNWQRYVTEHLMFGPITNLGVDGIFMDTLDTSELYESFRIDPEEFQGGYVDLVRAAKGAYPEHLLFANRGFSLMPGIRSSIDGVIFESFTQGVMLNPDGTINAQSPHTLWTNNRVTEDLVPARDRDGVRLLSLDYCGGADQPAADVCQQRAQNEGLLPYVTANSDLLTPPPAISP